jgi:ubiquinone/menaquinone biosynthesis C-methylase UbiE
MTKTPKRFLWATELLEIKPTDHILEIGCGAGILAEQIATRLTSGKLIAIDKSSSMVDKAQQRNSRFIDNGVSSFLAADFLKAELSRSYFNSIVAFNVNFFWKNPVLELLYIKQLLKPNGKLYVFYQAPFEITINAAEPIKQKLENNAFRIVIIQLKEFSPTSAFCIVAQPIQIS